MSAVLARGLTKEFHRPAGWSQILRGRFRGPAVRALAGADLEVAAGETLALMGPNGSGKTTLLRLLAGLLVPTAGEARVLGEDVARAGPALRRRVALVLPDERSFSYRLSGRRNLEFFAALHGFARAEARRRAGSWLERLGLEGDADRPYAEWSSGNRQRLALARGLLGEPELLLLDEPTRALDPAAALRLRRWLREERLGRPDRTVIVATHDLGEAGFLAGRIALLDRGRLEVVTGAAAAARQLGLADA